MATTRIMKSIQKIMERGELGDTIWETCNYISLYTPSVWQLLWLLQPLLHPHQCSSSSRQRRGRSSMGVYCCLSLDPSDLDQTSLDQGNVPDLCGGRWSLWYRMLPWEPCNHLGYPTKLCDKYSIRSCQCVYMSIYWYSCRERIWLYKQLINLYACITSNCMEYYFLYTYCTFVVYLSSIFWS